MKFPFLRGFIFQTAYSMRGVTESKLFLEKWNVYGIKKGDLNKEKKIEFHRRKQL